MVSEQSSPTPSEPDSTYASMIAAEGEKKNSPSEPAEEASGKRNLGAAHLEDGRSRDGGGALRTETSSLGADKRRPHLAAQFSSRGSSLARSRSYGGQDGYSCHLAVDDEEERGHEGAVKVEEGSGGDGEGKEFEVRWDGDVDPMNPRCMGRFRKWVIVVIVSMSSCCV